VVGLVSTRIANQRLPIGRSTVTQSTSATALRRVHATAEDCKDPAKLARILADHQQAVDDATTPARSVPFFGGILHKNIAFSAGVDLVLEHRLNRPYQGFFPLRVRAGTPAGAYPVEITQASSLNDKQITLRTSQFAIADVWVY
jgi:hypothetical protein